MIQFYGVLTVLNNLGIGVVLLVVSIVQKCALYHIWKSYVWGKKDLLILSLVTIYICPLLKQLQYLANMESLGKVWNVLKKEKEERKPLNFKLRFTVRIH